MLEEIFYLSETPNIITPLICMFMSEITYTLTINQEHV